MPEIFTALPGLEVPTGMVNRELTRWWAAGGVDDRPVLASDDAKATQLNFVLHFGFHTTPADAVVQFQTMLRFAQLHPARVVVLCPLGHDVPAPEIRAKIYGECFLGKTKADKRCVEFVMLSYSRSARAFLENQVSVCLSADLPLYYWAHRFSRSGALADYRRLLTRARRVVLDSATAPADAFAHPWPDPAAIRDLAHCRLLPVRQGLGQLLAQHSPAELAGGLANVAVLSGTALAAEGRVLLAWLRQRLELCGAGAEVAFAAGLDDNMPPDSLAVEFAYRSGNKFFRWRGDGATGRAQGELQLGAERADYQAAMRLLPPEVALSAAVFS